MSTTPAWSDSQLKARTQLLRWFHTHQREMPWRHRHPSKPDPYHVLISETMLQQTQVATVIPYYKRFLKRLPTLQALAKADLQTVLHLWQGLGYYRRARNLKACAEQAIEQFEGLPCTRAELITLPGIGPYTAAAIASIAFNEQAGVVDGNVSRVLARLHTWHQPVNASKSMKILQALADQWADHKRPGCINQAMMELGSRICTPQSPRCVQCPMQYVCKAHDACEQEELPVKIAKKPPKSRQAALLLLRCEQSGRICLWRQPEDALWAGLWLPCLLENTGSGEAALERLYDSCQLSAHHARHLGCFTHQLTHRTWSFDVHLAVLPPDQPLPEHAAWMNHQAASSPLPLAKPTEKALALLPAD